MMSFWSSGSSSKSLGKKPYLTLNANDVIWNHVLQKAFLLQALIYSINNVFTVVLIKKYLKFKDLLVAEVNASFIFLSI